MNQSRVIRGTVVRLPDAQPGLIVANGTQLQFEVADAWASPVAPSLNQVVEVSLEGDGKISRVLVVDASLQAQEKIQQTAEAIAAWTRIEGKAQLKRAVEWLGSHSVAGKRNNALIMASIGAAIAVGLLFLAFASEEPSERQLQSAVRGLLTEQFKMIGQKSPEIERMRLEKEGCERRDTQPQVYSCITWVSSSEPSGGQRARMRVVVRKEEHNWRLMDFAPAP